MLPFKIFFEDDVRRISPPLSTFEELVDAIGVLFGISNFTLKYLDDEDDLVTLTSTRDLTQAVELTVAADSKSLKIHVVTAKDSAEGAGEIPTDAAGNELPALCARIRPLLRSFAADPAIQVTLRDAVQVIFTMVSEGEPLSESVRTTLDTFPVLRDHALTQALLPYLECACARGEPLVPLALQLGSDAVGMLVQQIMIAISSGSAMPFSPWAMPQPWFGQVFGGPPPPTMPPPTMPSPVDRQPPPTTTGPYDEPPAVHIGVVCDGCNMEPITGFRYRCQECRDFDLCETCESKPNAELLSQRGHALTHTMIKYRRPREGGLRGMFGGRHGPFAGGPFGGPMPRGGPCGGGGFGRCGPFGGGWHGRGRMRGSRGGRGCRRSRSLTPGRQRGPFNMKIISSDEALGESVTLHPGQTATSTWTLCNVGGEPWPAGTSLVFWQGDRFGLHTHSVPACIPGDWVNVSVTVNAPAKPGMYSAKYRLKLPQDVQPPRKFGAVLPVRFCVEVPLQTAVEEPNESSEKVVQKVESVGNAAKDDKVQLMKRGPFNMKIADSSAALGESTTLRPGQTVTSTWTLCNTGVKPWPAGTCVVFGQGDRIGKAKFSVPTCLPGNWVEASVAVTAPTEPGQYSARYRLRLPMNIDPPRRFGAALTVSFRVEKPAEAEVDGSAKVVEESGMADVKSCVEFVPIDLQDENEEKHAEFETPPEKDLVAATDDDEQILMSAIRASLEEPSEKQAAPKVQVAPKKQAPPTKPVSPVKKHAASSKIHKRVLSGKIADEDQNLRAALRASLAEFQEMEKAKQVEPESKEPDVEMTGFISQEEQSVGNVLLVEKETKPDEQLSVGQHDGQKQAEQQATGNVFREAVPESINQEAGSSDELKAKYSAELNILRQMGFVNADLNLWLLEQNDGSVQDAATDLVKLQRST